MDKISGIIPASARVTNVDVKDQNNMRVTLPNRVDGMPMGPEVEPAWKAKDAKNVAIVTGVANGFFMKNKPEPAVEMETEEPLPSMQKPLPQPEGLFPKGSFIDRSA